MSYFSLQDKAQMGEHGGNPHLLRITEILVGEEHCVRGCARDGEARYTSAPQNL